MALSASAVHGPTFRRVSLAALIVFVAGGCQSYERRPLDMAAHQAAFLARTPESPEVQSFAAGLAARTPGEQAFSVTDGVSCSEAEAIALVFNAEMRVARLRAGIAKAAADNAGAWEDPTIGVDLTRIVESTVEPWKVFASVGLTIPISGRLEIEKQRAGIEHAAELARVAQHEWSVRMSVRRAWSEWSALEAELGSTRDFLSRVDQILSVVDAMEQAGEMPRTESRLFRIEKATRRAGLVLLESQMREVELRLHALMGLSPDAPLELQPGPIGSREHADVLGTRSPDILRQQSPAMLVVLAEYEAAEKSLELEVRKQYPDLHIGPGYGSEDGQDQVLLGLSLPVPIFNANRLGIAEAGARREVAKASVEATLEQLIASLHAAEVRRQAAIARRQALESEVVPLVDAQYADAREVAKLGDVNTLVLLESLSRQQEAKASLLAALRDEALAEVDLEELLGPTPDRSTSQPFGEAASSGVPASNSSTPTTAGGASR